MMKRILFALPLLALANPALAQRVTITGDSISNAYVGYYAGYYQDQHSNVTVIQQSGRSISDPGGGNGLVQHESDVVASTPDIVTILIGANDLASGTYASGTAYYTALMAHVASLKSQIPGVKVCVSTILPSTQGGTYNARRADANPLIRAALYQKFDCLIDFAANTTIGDDADASNTALYSDGTHPTDRNGTTGGHDYLYSVFNTALGSYITNLWPGAYVDNTTTTADVVVDAGETDASEQKWRGHCEFTASMTNWDDSILFPGLVGASPHPHQYFGNTSSDANTTYASLGLGTSGSCSGIRANLSSYWAPAFQDENGNQIVPEYVQMYYTRALNATFYHVYNIPMGLEMITGSKPGDPNYYTTPPGVTLGANQSFTGKSGFDGYQCLSAGSQYPDLQDAGLTCVAGDYIKASISLPNCWNGVNRTSVTGRSHVVHEVQNNSNGRRECPPSHPYQIAQIQLAFFYNHNGPNAGSANSFRNYFLKADRQDANPANWVANGKNMHTDYRERWKARYKIEFEDNCVGVGLLPGGNACNFGHFGGANRGNQPANIFTELTLGQRVISMTPQPGIAGSGRVRLRIN